MNSIKDRLEKCVSLALPDLPREEIARASGSSVAAWDSLATVSILSLVEEEFAIKVADDDLEVFVSFGTILDYLEGKVQAHDTRG